MGRAVPLALAALAALAGCGRVGYDAVEGDALTLRYPRDEVAAVLGVTAIDLAPTVSRRVAGFTIAPGLPAGVALDPSTGVIGGVPTAAVVDTTYTVTATAADGATARFAWRLTALPGSVADVTADFPDDDGGVDPVCYATLAGGCTLRAAVETANRRADRQVIVLIAGDYQLGSALEEIANDVTIVGAGATATQIGPATPRAGFGLITLTTPHQVALRALAAHQFGDVDGAVAHVTAGAIDIDHCHLADNASAGSGGALFVAGGAAAVVRRSLLTGNQSFGGCCGGWGGVIDAEGAGTTVDVDGCTATGNTSHWGSFAHITAGTTLRLTSSTLSDNIATRAGTLASPGGHYELVNVTLVRNTNTDTDSAGLYLFAAPAAYQLVNSIVAGNTDGTGAEHDCNRNDLATTLTSLGGNFIGDDAGNCAAYFTAASDHLATDPGLVADPPADHGGPTPTIPLAPDSPAHGAGEAAYCPPTDQRGEPRASPCDSGAVETP